MNHKDLMVWQLSVDLSVAVYRATRSFPSEEKFGLVSQMRRAAVSIPSNIAEGAARSSRKEFQQFLSIAGGSASELSTQLIISNRAGLLGRQAAEDLDKQLEQVTRLLHGLARSVGEAKASKA